MNQIIVKNRLPYTKAKEYGPSINKECVEIELKADSNNKNHNYVKVKYNTIVV